MSTHTKGPWTDATQFIVIGLLTDAALQLRQLTGENLEAYSRTFAALAQTALEKIDSEQKAREDAAPELLEALQRALGQLEGCKPLSGVHASSLKADIEIIKSAIQKAGAR